MLTGLAAAMFLGGISGPVSVHAGVTQEADSLSCAKVKDVDKLVGTPVDLDLSLLVLAPGCTVKKAAMLCTPTSINGGGDASGGAVDALGYLCFKAKCPGNLSLTGPVETRFTNSSLTRDAIKGGKLICVPYAAPI